MKTVAQQYICDLGPYQPGLPIELVARKYGLQPDKIIKLASNENPLGMSPMAKAALEQALPHAHRYPDQYRLVQALAQKLNVDPASVVLGNGSNDVLDLVARTFLNDGDEAISSQYAFAVYPIATQSVGATNVVVHAKDYGHDLMAMLAAVTPKTRVIWIANPNNPTGTFVSYAKVKQFLGNVPKRVVVVLDEAYHEYLDDKERVDTTRWLAQHPNLVITRTFSKIYGLAGLRVGYAIASPEIAELLNRVRQPFNANNLALAAAVAALDDDMFVRLGRRSNAAGRRALLRELKALGFRCLPAYGNFVTVEVPNATSVCDSLLAKGIIVRPLAGYGMPNHLRITVGLPKENQTLIDGLRL